MKLFLLLIAGVNIYFFLTVDAQDFGKGYYSTTNDSAVGISNLVASRYFILGYFNLLALALGGAFNSAFGHRHSFTIALGLLLFCLWFASLIVNLCL